MVSNKIKSIFKIIKMHVNQILKRLNMLMILSLNIQGYERNHNRLETS